jgi:hypothetical protein
MKISFCVIATILLGCVREACAADQVPWQQEFYPANGKGRVVVVITGDSVVKARHCYGPPKTCQFK